MYDALYQELIQRYLFKKMQRSFDNFVSANMQIMLLSLEDINAYRSMYLTLQKETIDKFRLLEHDRSYFYEQFQATEYCHIVSWVDKNYRGCREKGLSVDSVENIKTISFDYIIIAVLSEDVSKEIFDARLQFVFDRDQFRFFDAVKEEKYISEEFEEFMKFSGEGRNILIYGAGKGGMLTCEILRLCGYEPVAFSDSNVNLYNCEIMGLPVILLEQLVKEKDKYVVVIASEKFVSDIYRKLLRRIERNYLFYPMRRIFTAKPGWQYFDFFFSK